MTTRREFIAAAAAAGAGAALRAAGPSVRTGELVKGRKINIACVGCGGKGWDDVRNMMGENIVGLCDVDYARGAEMFAANPGAKVFRDWRDMLAALDSQIDAVVVSTPDHMHFPVAMRAMEMGKHVFVQKPLAHTVSEARQMRAAARLHKVVTQMGNQGHSNEGTRLLKEWVDAGVIGDVHEVHIWTNRPIWPQDREPPAETQPVPATLDWNRWLGVAPWRPYNSCYHPGIWRGWWDFGTGAIGDMGCHTMDASFWALDLAAPEHVSAEVVGGNEYSCPAGSIVTYKFPARGAMPPVTVKWFDGVCKPPRPKELDADVGMDIAGQLLYGTKGVILSPGDYCDIPRLIPRSAMKEFRKHMPPKTLPRIPNGHHQNWLDGIRGRVEAPCSNFDYASPLCELGMLGAVAVRARTSFKWDSATMTCVDNPAAQKLISKTYRMF